MTLNQRTAFAILRRLVQARSTTKLALLLGFAFLFASSIVAQAPAAQSVYKGPPNHPSVMVYGQTYTPAAILNRNMGTDADQTTQFPPHNIIANIYYVGTRNLSSFLIVTPEGNILIDTTYERNIPVILKSVEQLGFKFSDIKIILGNHAHSDHMEGDALAKQLTGAKVEIMAEDVPMAKKLMPGGKEHPVDVVLHDLDTVSLGGTVLTAHLVAGHTPGCTTYTTTVMDHGKALNVVFGCSLRAGNFISPEVSAEFQRTFPVARSLPCDVPLGDHPAEIGMLEKYPKIKPGAPNPYIDKEGCHKEIDIEEAMYKAIMAEQQQNAAQPKP
jgi:metallo-beta-lactamase class B